MNAPDCGVRWMLVVIVCTSTPLLPQGPSAHSHGANQAYVVRLDPSPFLCACVVIVSVMSVKMCGVCRRCAIRGCVSSTAL